MTEQRFEGIPASDGLAVGQLFFYERITLAGEVGAEKISDVDAEVGQLRAAVEEVRNELEETKSDVAGRGATDEAAIFDAQLLFLDDPALIGAAEQAISADKSSAARAIQQVAAEIASTFAAIDDPYLQARGDDVRDVAGRIVRRLAGIDTSVDLPERAIIVAEELLPSDTTAMDLERVAGFVVRSGSPTAHAAILARSFQVPMIIGVSVDAADSLAGVRAVIDGTAGHLVINPDSSTLDETLQRIESLDQERETIEALVDQPAITLDGTRVHLYANIGGVEDARQAIESGAEGVGLFRTEFLFIDQPELPSEDSQYQVYRHVAEIFGDRPVIIRTLDAGGDKPIPAIHSAELAAEMNPFLGVRGIRLTLAKPDLFQTQLRALLRAATHGNIQIMFPMVTTQRDIDDGRAAVEQAAASLQSDGLQYRADVPLGIMIETPSSAIALDRLIASVDFVSIGTNDLSQYTLAIDRTNASVSSRYDEMDASILRLIERTLRIATAAGKHAGICGEMAGNPQAIPTLIGLGARDLSMSPGRIGPAKALIRKSSIELLQAEADEQIKEHSAG